MDFNQTALITGMEGNDTLPWMYRQGIKHDIQRELLGHNYAMLEDLQTAAISMDDLLFSFKKQTQPERKEIKRTNNQPQQNKYHNQENPQPRPPPDQNTMELDRLSADEYRKCRAAGLCFKCRKKGLAWQCLRHNQPNQQRPPRHFPFQKRTQGKVAAIEATPHEDSTAQLASTSGTQKQNTDSCASPSMYSCDLTKDSDFLDGC